MTFSIIQKSQIEGGLRMDAEYYQPEHLKVEKKLKSIDTKSIDEISQSVVNFGAYSLCNYIEWRDKGVPYLNVENIKDGYVDFNDVKFIDENINKILKKSEIKEGQIILTMAGTIGNAAVAHKIPSLVNSNQATAKITLKKGISPYYLVAFLNSYYGKKQTERSIVSSVQPNIFLWQIKGFRIPVLPEEEQDGVTKCYKQGLEELENSKLFYQQAENLLLEELGLKNYQAQEKLGCIVNFSEVEEEGRMDAEYFITKFSSAVSKIPSKFLRELGEIATFKKGFEPGGAAYQEEGKLFIRVSNISKTGIVDKDQKYLSEEIYQKLAEEYQPKIGEILLTKDASPGVAVLVEDPIEGIVSGGILRLKVKEDIDNDYLTLCLNSIVVQEQVKRDSGGSVIAHWRPEQIKNVLIPIFPAGTRQKIADLVRKSHEVKKKSKELLEEAKRRVEEMIEKGGENATREG